jgi:hypothetical protein
MSEIFERAIDISLEKKDPKRKRERRLEREREQGISGGQSRPDEISAQPKIEGEEDEAKSRYIPSEVKERVYERADHQCNVDSTIM